MAYSDQFCDLHGFIPDRPYFTAHCQSNCTIIRVLGCDNIYSEDELQENLSRAAQQLGSALRSPYHSITITLERSRNNREMTNSYRAAMQQAAEAKKLNASVLIDETISVLEDRLRYEEILIACWTSPGAGFPEEIEIERQEARETWGRFNAKNAMDPLVTLQSLDGPHMAFVHVVMDVLATAHVKAEVLNPRKEGQDNNDNEGQRNEKRKWLREDLAAVRRALLFHETPHDWQPQTTFERQSIELKPYKTNDISSLFAPPLSHQIMTSNAAAASDMRSVEFGGRTYAVVTAAMFPRQMPLFRLLSSRLEQIDGRGETDMPWRYALHLSGGVKIPLLIDIFNTLLSFASPSNNNKRLGFDGIRHFMTKDIETFVGAKMLAVTWVEPDEPRELLSARRSRLVRSLESWNSPTIIESNINPMRSLAETAAGMTRVAKTGRSTIAPVTELALSFPFHRTAPIYKDGQSIMISPEGKPIHLKAHSSDQNFWLTLISAPPGSGKSVFMNRTNLEFATFTSGSRLPFIGVIDIGPSSMGFIDLMRNMTPAEQHHQLLYIRLKNEKRQDSHFINPCDLGLGNRKPRESERVFVESFLAEIIARDDTRVNRDLVAALVKAVYSEASDLDISSSPKRWQAGMNRQIDEICGQLEIPLRESSRWWSVVDALMRKGRPHEAGIAQRYASPTLEDFSRIISSRQFKDDFGEEACHNANLAIMGAIEQFPVFSRPTTLDIGDARIVSIDLNDVIIKGADAERGTARQNSLMYMIASNLFLRQISGAEDDIQTMTFPEEMKANYESYWLRRFQDIAETPKRFAMDEFHNTGSTPSMVAMVEVMAREGRKWGLEIVLASQIIDDFKHFRQLYSTVVLLDAVDKDTRDGLQNIFGFSNAVKKQIADYLHGPRPGLGAGFVIGAKLKTNFHWLRVYNQLAPTMLWALDTTPANRNLRNALVRKIGFDRALKLLVARFPRGTAVDYVEQFRTSDQSFEDESIYEKLSAQLIKDNLDTLAEAA